MMPAPARYRIIVAVRFPGSDRTYDYFCDFPVAVGDQVIVDTRHGEATVEVVEIKSHSDRATAWVNRKAEKV